MRKRTLITCLCLTLISSVASAVEQGELPLKVQKAFPNLRVRRPVVITNAGDGSGRLFLVTQQGVIQYVDPQDRDAEETKVFLDIESQVVYKDKENEEGLLGVAFHPKYRENGQLFVYYTTTDEPHTSVVSRFRVSKDDPNKADPSSEEELLRVKQPYWNHNGGGLVFGRDGYLYISLGDGGSGNDPHGNGQNVETLLGSILRIDVNNKGEKTAYAIPKDNPFVGKAKARPEIFAYGMRNVWGLSMDRETGAIWAADVGQKLWEEINILQNGGNYGWAIREGMHKFGPDGVGPSKKLVEPIWEYDHETGKSITGGYVYRGKKLPGLVGSYVYADYVTGKLWALKYDYGAKKVLANHTIPARSIPVMTFGEDEQGEIYFGDSFGFIHEIVKAN